VCVCVCEEDDHSKSLFDVVVIIIF
jgi:hypothetical protein